MKPIGDGLYECVFLRGHPSLSASNTDDGSYHSRDIFQKHPSLPNRWRYVSRLDDQITLVNGEKVHPLWIEGTIRQHPLVQEAVVVGIQKAVPGLLIFRSKHAQDLDDKAIVDQVWRAVEDANSRAEQFSRISRGLVKVLPAGVTCPATDKGSMIRAQVYRQFATAIEEMYPSSEAGTGALLLGVKETEGYLLKLCQEDLGQQITQTDNLYSKGVDSLQAISLRRMILRDFRFPGERTLRPNIVYEMGSIARLAKEICAIQQGRLTDAPDGSQALGNSLFAHSLVQKYGSFKRHHAPGTCASDRKAVILTGATGSTGAHLLERLVDDTTVSTVYCLTRQSRPKEAILRSLAHKGLAVVEPNASKIVGLESRLDRADLGLDPCVLHELRQSVSLVIHTAWPVNFALPLESFEPHIQGLHNLINFSQSVDSATPAVVLFCSSISTALASSVSEIEETPLAIESALSMGYSQSKWVGEQIVSHSRSMGARAYSLRIGQISGHSQRGLWNDSEAIPLLVRSALTLKALPEMDATCSWLPVDRLAPCILEIAGTCLERAETAIRDGVDSSTNGDVVNGTGDGSVYNIVNPHTFTWAALLDQLKRSGFQFDAVPFAEWLQLLEASEARHEERINPAVKLIYHYRKTYGQGAAAELAKTFTMQNARRDSETLREGTEMLESGVLRRYARDWLNRWETSSARPATAS
ncbi:uncharacterized protein LDX57_007880 [Aspergillus melleus]|uniref:uncharacterized protein n=1 Tax=Aspergillus melleus TaxID=138277 RepID=UPI001E8DC0F2|nr:uncharacterized protein LDX57_007880 [Aspergillus melleus]KAH8430211.1 hypothetical protein LDX57_007880 [Aspergillus melleus]